MKMKIIAVSGGFDPVHKGHIQMIEEASKIGPVMVIINSDEWLMRKKGYVFMPWEDRAYIMGNIKGVRWVSQVDDSDNTVCEALIRLKPHAFANGGDRMETNTPEMDICENLGVEMLWNIGGQKVESSSNLVNKARWEERQIPPATTDIEPEPELKEDVEGDVEEPQSESDLTEEMDIDPQIDDEIGFDPVEESLSWTFAIPEETSEEE